MTQDEYVEAYEGGVKAERARALRGGANLPVANKGEWGMGFFWHCIGGGLLATGGYILGGTGGWMMAVGAWLSVSAMFDTAMDKLEEIRLRLGNIK